MDILRISAARGRGIEECRTIVVYRFDERFARDHDIAALNAKIPFSAPMTIGRGLCKRGGLEPSRPSLMSPNEVARTPVEYNSELRPGGWREGRRILAREFQGNRIRNLRGFGIESVRG